jgi:hypothetical protein
MFTTQEWKDAATAHLEARQCERAIGGLREAIRRCKPGSAKHGDYAKRIALFEKASREATDALEAIFIRNMDMDSIPIESFTPGH